MEKYEWPLEEEDVSKLVLSIWTYLCCHEVCSSCSHWKLGSNQVDELRELVEARTERYASRSLAWLSWYCGLYDVYIDHPETDLDSKPFCRLHVEMTFRILKIIKILPRLTYIYYMICRQLRCDVWFYLPLFTIRKTRWWFQICFIFSPYFGVGTTKTIAETQASPSADFQWPSRGSVLMWSHQVPCMESFERHSSGNEWPLFPKRKP